MNTRKPLIAALAAYGLGLAVLWSATAAAKPPPKAEKSQANAPAHAKAGENKPAEVGKPEGKKLRDIARPEGRREGVKPGERGRPEGKEPHGTACACGRRDENNKPCPCKEGEEKQCEGGDKSDVKCKDEEGTEDLRKLGLKAAKREARLEALKKRIEELKSTMEERRAKARERVHKRWGAAAVRPEVLQELRLHAMRLARLTRIRELAAVEVKAKLEERATKALDKENRRHEKRMEAFTSGGAATAPAAAPAAPAAPAAAPAAPETKGGAQ